MKDRLNDSSGPHPRPENPEHISSILAWVMKAREQMVLKLFLVRRKSFDQVVKAISSTLSGKA
jgi:hypothetical protein